MQNSVISIWITNLYGFQPSSVVFASKTATFRLELQLWMVPSLHLSFCACKTALFATERQVYKGSSHHLCFFFSMQNSDFMTRLTSLYGFQTSSVVLTTHNSVLSTRIKRPYGFQPSPVILCMQNSDFSTLNTSLYWSQPSSEVFAC